MACALAACAASQARQRAVMLMPSQAVRLRAAGAATAAGAAAAGEPTARLRLPHRRLPHRCSATGPDPSDVPSKLIESELFMNDLME